MEDINVSPHATFHFFEARTNYFFLLVSGFGKCFVGAEENLLMVHR